jgi:epoxyqueuosine reductase
MGIDRPILARYAYGVDLREIIESAARREGLDGVAIMRLEDLRSAPDVEAFNAWLDHGLAGEMGYLKGERAEKRAEPERVLPGAKSAICVALNYNSDAPRSTECGDSGRGWISRYAWGSDYHDALRNKLDRLLDSLRRQIPWSFEARVYVDTGPVLERALARQTQLGWLGKNTCLIQEKLGSWFFLGEILTTLDIPAEWMEPPAADRCGTCTRCIDACPTQAIVEPRVLDATRCISYWTIEYKGEFSPDVVPGLGRHVFGCDICQDVCPWNRRAPVTVIPEFQARAGLVNTPLEDLAAMSEQEFRDKFRNSPLRRLGYRRFQRNVRAALENAGRNGLPTVPKA